MQQKWAQVFWQNAFHWKNANLSKWNVPQERVNSKRSRANNKPACVPASSPTNLTSKKLSVLVKMPPDTSAKDQHSDFRWAEGETPQDPRVEMHSPQQSCQECISGLFLGPSRHTIEFPFYVYLPSNFILFQKWFLPQLWHFFTKVTFCFLASFSKTGVAIERSRNCSVCNFENLANLLLKHLSLRRQKCLAQRNGDLCRITRPGR